MCTLVHFCTQATRFVLCALLTINGTGLKVNIFHFEIKHKFIDDKVYDVLFVTVLWV